MRRACGEDRTPSGFLKKGQFQGMSKKVFGRKSDSSKSKRIE